MANTKRTLCAALVGLLWICGCGQAPTGDRTVASGGKADVINIDVTLATDKLTYQLDEPIVGTLTSKDTCPEPEPGSGTYCFPTWLYVTDGADFRMQRFEDGQWTAVERDTSGTKWLRGDETVTRTWSVAQKGLYRLSDRVGIGCSSLDEPVSSDTCRNVVTLHSQPFTVGFGETRWTCEELGWWAQAVCRVEGAVISEYELCLEDTPGGDQVGAAQTCCNEGDYPWCGRPGCIQVVEEAMLGLSVSETVFDITGCSTEAIHSDIRDYLLNQSGYEFEWFDMAESTIEAAKAMLQADDTAGDGSGPYPAADIEKIEAFYNSDQAAAKIEVGEYADSYWSGTGITGLVGLFNADQTRMILLTKFQYAE